MLFELLPTLLFAFAFLACAYALIKGGADGRIGAGVILANLLASFVNEIFGGQQIGTLSIDGLTAVILLVIAVRYASVWLGLVMLLYALQFAVQAYYLVLDRPRDVLSVRLNNLDFFLVCLCLAVGSAISHVRRVRARRATMASTA